MGIGRRVYFASVAGAVDAVVGADVENEDMKIHISYDEVELKETWGDESSELLLQGVLLQFRQSEIQFTADTTDQQSSELLLCLPIFSFRNRYVDPRTRELQLHGIVVTPTDEPAMNKSTAELAVAGPPTVGQTYKRVGYFWTLEVDTRKKKLHKDSENPKLGLIRLRQYAYESTE